MYRGNATQHQRCPLVVPSFIAVGAWTRGSFPPAAHLTFSPGQKTLGSLLTEVFATDQGRHVRNGCTTGGLPDRNRDGLLAWPPGFIPGVYLAQLGMGSSPLQWHVQALRQGWASAGSAWPGRDEGFQKGSRGRWCSGEALPEHPVW